MKIFKQIPNILTSLRIVLTLIYLVLVYDLYSYNNNRLYFISTVIVFILICATDFMDGKIARKMKVTSRLGGFLDVTADFIFIISSNTVLAINNVIPLWFIVVILAKFIEFLVTSHIIKRHRNIYNSVFIFDYFGRIAAVNFFLIPGVALFSYRGLNILIYITLILVLISSLARCINCYKVLKLKVTIDNYHSVH